MKPRAVFFDRDDTVIVNVPYLGDPSQVRLCPRASEALARLRAAGFLLFIVSNQSGVGRGLITVEQVAAVNAEMERQLGLTFDGIYNSHVTPEDPRGTDRKPSPELVLKAGADHGLDLAESFFVGDKLIDVQCGHNAGCRSILVMTGTEAEARAGAETLADYVAHDLDQAASWILQPSVAKLQPAGARVSGGFSS
jgi:D-glycero-D-manno-heptose 1,7-bisphosphate phosphatase